MKIGYATRNDLPGIRDVINRCLSVTIAQDYKPEIIAAIRGFYASIDPFEKFDPVLCVKEDNRVVGCSGLEGDTVKMFYLDPHHKDIKSFAVDLFEAGKVEGRRKNYSHIRVYALQTSLNFCLRTLGGKRVGEKTERIGRIEFPTTEIEWEL